MYRVEMTEVVEKLVGVCRIRLYPALLWPILWREICRQKDYHFIYKHRLLLVFGLMFSRCLTESAVINVLMWYLTFHGGDLVISAILTHFCFSLSLMLMIIMSNLAYLVVGRFWTLLLCDTAYIIGLMIFWLFAPFDVKWVVVVALILVALGRSGFLLLFELLFDLMDDIDNSQDRTRERSIARTTMWSRIAETLGSIVATLWVAPNALARTFPSWDVTFLACIIAMTTTLIIFVIGYRYYPQERLTDRSGGPFLRVLCAGIQKLLKRISWRCFVNPIRQEGSLRLDTTGQEARWNEDKAIIKKHLQMSPLWVLYLVVSLILANGYTFFYEQFNNLNTAKFIPIQIYDVAFSFSAFAIPWLYSWISDSRKTDKLKIGLGLLCAIITCVIAWRLEVSRLKLVQQLVYDDEPTSLSFLWLVPQFCFLGGMSGLTDEGLLDFRSHVQDEGIRDHRQEFMILLTGIGMVINFFLILIFQDRVDWFGDSINTSRLDKYFMVLACICLGSFIIYCCIATVFYNDAEQSQQEARNDSQHNQELSNNGDSQQDHQLLAINDSNQERNSWLMMIRRIINSWLMMIHNRINTSWLAMIVKRISRS